MNNSICQFYVIFGDKNFVVPINNNVYINATNLKDIKELSNRILDEYKEKAKSKTKVGSEIIFLIPNEKYKAKTEEIIKNLKVNGKIELIPTKTTVSKKEENRDEDVKKIIPTSTNEAPK